MPAPTFRPQLDGLDDRLTPATFTVTTATDGGAGSLRAAINQANASPGEDVINFNIPGTGTKRIVLASALPVVRGTVTIDGATQPGYNNSPLIVLNGKDAGAANGLEVAAGADNCVVRALVVGNFGKNGIVLRSDGNRVEDCFIGSNAAGTRGAGNRIDAVSIAAGSSGNTIGGDGKGNLIAASFRYGVLISGDGADNNTVASNSVGNNLAGGVVIQNKAAGNTIGGKAAALGNVIGANGNHGVLITGAGTDGNVVAGNFIGANSGGTAGVGNARDGVAVFDGPAGTQVGLTGAGNLISANGRFGVHVRGDGTTGTVVAGNFIGLTGSGAAALGNAAAGVRVANGADGTVVGGSAAGAPNTISGNKSFGVIVTGADEVVVRGNRIGTGVTGGGSVPNASHGIFVTGGSSKTTVGGVNLADGNLVANNGGNGVLVGTDPAAGFTTPPGAGTAVLSNAFVANAKLGINRGANNGVDAPPVAVTGAVAAADKTKIDVTVAVTGPAGAVFRVEVYSSADADPSGFGEGRFLLGVIEVTATGAGAATRMSQLQYAATAGTKITATATNLGTNDTSEFSAVFTAT